MNSELPPLIKDPKQKPAFDYDDFGKIPNVMVGVKTKEEFDWAELDRLLGESESREEDRCEQLASVLGTLCRWIADGEDLEQIGSRAVAAMRHAKGQTVATPDR